MTTARPPAQKVTISLPADLLAYADAHALRLNTGRSQFISMVLAQFRANAEEQLAAEGYQFYAAEAADFAEASAHAAAEALDHGR